MVDPVGVVGFNGVIHKNGDVISAKDVPSANLKAWIRFKQVERGAGGAPPPPEATKPHTAPPPQRGRKREKKKREKEKQKKVCIRAKGARGGLAGGGGGVVMVLKFVFHVDISDLAPGLSSGLIAVLGLIGTIVAIYGRVTATKQIGDAAKVVVVIGAMLASLGLASCAKDQNGKLHFTPAFKAKAAASGSFLADEAVKIASNTVDRFAQSEMDALIKNNFQQSSGDLLRTFEGSIFAAGTTEIGPAITALMKQWLPDKTHWQNYAEQIGALVNAYAVQHPNNPAAVNAALEQVALALNTKPPPPPAGSP